MILKMEQRPPRPKPSLTVAVIFLFIILPHLDASTVIAPVNLDPRTSLYTVSFGQGLSLLLDVGNPMVWSTCPVHHPTVPCSSFQCSAPFFPTSCRSKVCTAQAQNPITHQKATADLTYMEGAIDDTDGRKPLAPTSFHNIISSCAPSSLLRGLPTGATGSVALSRSMLSLNAQMPGVGSSKFAFCLPANDSKPGVIFFGDGPYYILPPGMVEATQYQSLVPLSDNVFRRYDYFLPFNTIFINNVNSGDQAATLIKYSGSTRLSTVVPYTTVSRPLFNGLLQAFDNLTSSFPRASPVKPFKRCLNVGGRAPRDLFYAIPYMRLKNDDGASWEFHTADIMKPVSEGVSCLAFLDGGIKPADDVVFGAYQMKERLVVVDGPAMRVGISATNINYINGYCGDFMSRV